LAVPVIAAKEDHGVQTNISGTATQDNGQSQNVKRTVGGVEDNITAARETIREEHRDTQVGNQKNTTTNTRNISQLHETVQQSREEHAATLDNKSAVRQGWTKNENEVRLAVHTLLAMENFTEGIGPQVSAIAREFNNSANSTQRLEERIRNRDAFSRFFFGGDRDAATELANITAQNQVRIGQIRQIMNTTTLDTETRTMMDEQLQVLQQQVTQEQQLSAQEQQDRGMFGWMGR
jgi:hypothetical protein